MYRAEVTSVNAHKTLEQHIFYISSHFYNFE